MNELPELLKTLHLKYVEPQLANLMEEARIHSVTYDAFLRRVLSLEVEARQHTAHQNRRKAAHLPMSKTLDAFDFSFQPSLNERLVREVAELSFVRTHSNVVFLGPPGVGNTRPTYYPYRTDHACARRNGDGGRSAPPALWAYPALCRHR